MYPIVPVLILYSQPLLQFFSNLVITPKTLPRHDIFEASKEIWTSKIWAVWWMGNKCPFDFCDFFLFFWNLCATVLKEDVNNIFVRSNFRETQLLPWPCGIISAIITPFFICCWTARATRVTELRSIFLGPCNSWSPTTNWWYQQHCHRTDI